MSNLLEALKQGKGHHNLPSHIVHLVEDGFIVQGSLFYFGGTGEETMQDELDGLLTLEVDEEGNLLPSAVKTDDFRLTSP